MASLFLPVTPSQTHLIKNTITPQLNIASYFLVYIARDSTISIIRKDDLQTTATLSIRPNPFLFEYWKLKPIIDFLKHNKIHDNINEVYLFNDRLLHVQFIANYFKINRRSRVLIVEEGLGHYQYRNSKFKKLRYIKVLYYYSLGMYYNNPSVIQGNFSGIDTFVTFTPYAFPDADTKKKMRIGFSNSVVKRQYSGDSVVYISQPFIFEGILNESRYKKLLTSMLVSSHFKERVGIEKPIYILHPLEAMNAYSTNFSSFLWDNFQVIRLSYRIEDAIEYGEISPKCVYGIYTSALLYIKVFYGIDTYIIKNENILRRYDQVILSKLGIELVSVGEPPN